MVNKVSAIIYIYYILDGILAIYTNRVGDCPLVEQSASHTIVCTVPYTAVQQFECIDDTIYGEEYSRIANRLEELKNKRSSVTVVEITRQETLGRVRDITEVLWSMDTIEEFDEELFGMLVERIKAINLVQVEFVLQSGFGVIETV